MGFEPTTLGLGSRSASGILRARSAAAFDLLDRLRETRAFLSATQSASISHSRPTRSPRRTPARSNRYTTSGPARFNSRTASFTVRVCFDTGRTFLLLALPLEGPATVFPARRQSHYKDEYGNRQESALPLIAKSGPLLDVAGNCIRVVQPYDFASWFIEADDQGSAFNVRERRDQTLSLVSRRQRDLELETFIFGLVEQGANLVRRDRNLVRLHPPILSQLGGPRGEPNV
jgi:hypothetical protein